MDKKTKAFEEHKTTFSTKYTTPQNSWIARAIPPKISKHDLFFFWFCGLVTRSPWWSRSSMCPYFSPWLSASVSTFIYPCTADQYLAGATLLPLGFPCIPHYLHEPSDILSSWYCLRNPRTSPVWKKPSSQCCPSSGQRGYPPPHNVSLRGHQRSWEHLPTNQAPEAPPRGVTSVSDMVLEPRLFQ